MLLGRRRNVRNQSGDLGYGVHNLAQSVAGTSDQIDARLHLASTFGDQLVYLPRGIRGALCERAHLRSDDCKSTACVAGTGRFDTCIQGEQVGLERDVVDDLDDGGDPVRAFGDLVHRCNRVEHDTTAVFGVALCGGHGLICTGCTARGRTDRSCQIVQRCGGFLEGGRGTFGSAGQAIGGRADVACLVVDVLGVLGDVPQGLCQVGHCAVVVDPELFVAAGKGLLDGGRQVPATELAQADPKRVDNFVLLVFRNLPLSAGLAQFFLLQGHVVAKQQDPDRFTLGIAHAGDASIEHEFFCAARPKGGLADVSFATHNVLKQRLRRSVPCPARQHFVKGHPAGVTFAHSEGLPGSGVRGKEIASEVELGLDLIGFDGLDYRPVQPILGHVLPLQNVAQWFASVAHDTGDGQGNACFAKAQGGDERGTFAALQGATDFLLASREPTGSVEDLDRLADELLCVEVADGFAHGLLERAHELDHLRVHIGDREVFVGDHLSRGCGGEGGALEGGFPLCFRGLGKGVAQGNQRAADRADFVATPGLRYVDLVVPFRQRLDHRARAIERHDDDLAEEEQAGEDRDGKDHAGDNHRDPTFGAELLSQLLRGPGVDDGAHDVAVGPEMQRDGDKQTVHRGGCLVCLEGLPGQGQCRGPVLRAGFGGGLDFGDDLAVRTDRDGANQLPARLFHGLTQGGRDLVGLAELHGASHDFADQGGLLEGKVRDEIPREVRGGAPFEVGQGSADGTDGYGEHEGDLGEHRIEAELGCAGHACCVS